MTCSTALGRAALGLGVLISVHVVDAHPAHSQSTTEFTYDVHGRLQSVERSEGTSTAYTYDAAGNRTRVLATSVVADTTPDAFTLGGPSSGASGAWVSSNTVSITGINAPTPVSVAGGQYRIDSGNFTTTAGTLNPGQTVRVRAQAPATAGASQTVTLNIGGVSGSFQVTATADTAPNAFSLGGPATAASGAWASSSTITVAGINAAAPVSISGGQYRINAGAWQTAAASVAAGQTVQVRAQAPAAAGTSQTATLNIGGVSGSFQVTAAAANRPPVAVNDTTTLKMGTSKSIMVLSNDSDPDGDPITVTSVTQPFSGTVSIGPNGSYVIFTAPGYTDLTTFTYTISDGRGGTSSALVKVTINNPGGPLT